ncbi:hypothetical protein K8374_06200 [Pseudomonas sp. p1(2021b)]|uniref:alginate O-acetyltransferase AlgX-related protein n=1 Tax=Pseudomonas sp. p1(2021b) TaxID=2874628 RepID=UPI001CCE5052|nr:hypothetical protein [Pseudomonas sp. p1(2021b)]UBM26572.1 hypothetical protein K8374_06200 [Pseudomonas sp. p1(2021b)]
MKVKSVALVAIAAVIAIILPATNIITGAITNPFSWKSLKENAFATDYYTGLLNSIRYSIGYSTSPKQAVVGYNGWLFLGDQYANSMSVSRSKLFMTTGKMDARKAWREKWRETILKDFGAKFYVTIAPNKEEVYSENLPNWAKPYNKLPYSSFLNMQHDESLIHLHDRISSEKSSSPIPLYYKNDSHWNESGAWIAYQAISKHIKSHNPNLTFLAQKDISISNAHRTGGDISKFLFIENQVTDFDPIISTKNNSNIIIRSFESGAILYSGKNKRIDSPSSTIVVTSSDAKNDIKVLWLRDSFGTHLSPLFASTFKTVYQRHWGGIITNDLAFRSLIAKTSPDIVILTIVSRSEFELTYFNK